MNSIKDLNRKALTGLVKRLQEIISNRHLTVEDIRKFREILKNIGFAYDVDKFPELQSTEKFEVNSGYTPNNLAEALLWKLGKWKSYKNFSNYFAEEESAPTKDDVVFFAFAKHLSNNGNPIYDQHVLRAIWAVDSSLTKQDRQNCKKRKIGVREQLFLIFAGSNIRTKLI